MTPPPPCGTRWPPQVAAYGYTLTREACGAGQRSYRPGPRTIRVRPDVADAQAVKTLAHEFAHIECGHTADGYDYRGCRGRAEVEAESVAYIVTALAGLDSLLFRSLPRSGMMLCRGAPPWPARCPGALPVEDSVVTWSSSAMSFFALSLLLQEFLLFFGWCALASFAVGVCWLACSAIGASRRSTGVDHGKPAPEDEAEHRREAARGIAELELWLMAQPPQAQDPGGAG